MCDSEKQFLAELSEIDELLVKVGKLLKEAEQVKFKMGEWKKLKETLSKGDLMVYVDDKDTIIQLFSMSPKVTIKKDDPLVEGVIERIDEQVKRYAGDGLTYTWQIRVEIQQYSEVSGRNKEEKQ